MNAFSKDAEGQKPSQNKKSRPNLTQVAKAAGVSRTTASMVLSQKVEAGRISAETCQRVLDAARALDYSPNLLGRSLHTGTTHALAFFNCFRTYIGDDLYMYRLSNFLEHAAGAHGYDVLTHCDYSRSPEDQYQIMNGGRTDGVILFAPAHDEPLYPMLRRSRLPVVVVNALDPEGVLTTVRDDSDLGMSLVAKNLASLGHKRVTYLHSPGNEAEDVPERLQFLKKHCPEHNIDLRVKEFAYGRLDEVVRLAMEDPSQPTALITSTDRIATLAIETLVKGGYRIPEEVTVVGYDGIHWPSTHGHIPGSVQVDFKKLCNTAIDLLIGMAQGTLTVRPTEVRIPVTFFPGTTVGPARHRAMEQ